MGSRTTPNQAQAQLQPQQSQQKEQLVKVIVMLIWIVSLRKHVVLEHLKEREEGYEVNDERCGDIIPSYRTNVSLVIACLFTLVFSKEHYDDVQAKASFL